MHQLLANNSVLADPVLAPSYGQFKLRFLAAPAPGYFTPPAPVTLVLTDALTDCYL